jgi:hypothetical protein
MRFYAVLFVFAACGPTGGSNSSGGSGGSNSGGSGGMYAGGSGGNTTGGSGGAGGGIDSNPDAMDCGEQTFMLQRLPPDLLIVQDQSGSMMDPPSGGGASKWAQMTGAINMSLSTSQAQQARWGIVFFPNDGFCGTSTTPDVAVGPNTQGQIQSSLAGHSPNGATPTQAAVRAATTYLTGLSDTNPKFIVLATDGQPNCGSGVDDNAGAEQAVTDAKNMGINTFVIGISADSTSDGVLNQMAMNGGEQRTSGPPYYYSVQNQTDFVNAIAAITGTVVSCTFRLQMPPPYPDRVTIVGNGMPIPRDPTHMNGWDFGAGNMSITFYGQYCQQLQQGVIVTVQAIFGCPPIGIHR